VVRIAVGSTNPVKKQAAQVVLGALFDADFIFLAVESGVRAQPWGDLETRTGAINRARAALRSAGADLGVGFEGGVVENEQGLFTCAWAAVVDAEGTLGLGGNTMVQLPERVAGILRQGGELGPAMDELLSTQNVKHREGAIGVLTDGLVNRQASFEFMLRLALAPFRSPQWYQWQDGLHTRTRG
jgi:inosine/xanthosine triphosphatase